MGPDPGAGRCAIGGHLGEPDRRFDCFDLAEEWAQIVELVMPPMLEQPRRLRSDLPLVRVRQVAPCFDIGADLVDDRGWVVFLLGSRQTVASAKLQLPLAG